MTRDRPLIIFVFFHMVPCQGGEKMPRCVGRVGFGVDVMHPALQLPHEAHQEQDGSRASFLGAQKLRRQFIRGHSVAALTRRHQVAHDGQGVGFVGNSPNGHLAERIIAVFFEHLGQVEMSGRVSLRSGDIKQPGGLPDILVYAPALPIQVSHAIDGNQVAVFDSHSKVIEGLAVVRLALWQSLTSHVHDSQDASSRV